MVIRAKKGSNKRKETRFVALSYVELVLDKLCLDGMDWAGLHGLFTFFVCGCWKVHSLSEARTMMRGGGFFA